MSLIKVLPNQLDDRYRAFAILIPAFVLLPTLLYPFMLDQSTYQSMALQFLKFGRIPYLGTWDMNFPGIVYIHAISIFLFGNNELGFRTLDLLMRSFMGAMLFSILVPRLGRRTALIAVTAMALILVRDIGSSHGQRDGFAAFFIVCGIWMLLKRPLTTRFSAAVLCVSGITMGIAISIRPTFALIPLCVLIGFRYAQGVWIRNALLFCAGILVPIGLITLPYAFYQGGLDELYLATIRFNLDIYASSRYRVPLVRGLTTNAQLFCTFVLVFASVSRNFYKRRANAKSNVPISVKFENWLFWSLYLSAELSVILMGKYFRYHYELLFLLTAVLIGVAMGSLLDLVKEAKLRKWTMAVLVVGAFVTVYPWRVIGLFAKGMGNKQGPLEFTRLNLDLQHPHERSVNVALAKYLLAHTNGDDRIEYPNEQPEILWRTALQPVTRFTTIFPIAMQKPYGGYTDYQVRWRKGFVDSIASVRPKFVILTEDPPTMLNFLSQPPDSLTLEIPGFAALLDSSYLVDTVIGTNILYLRRK